jgi:hypothetical protein
MEQINYLVKFIQPGATTGEGGGGGFSSLTKQVIEKSYILKIFCYKVLY